MLNCLIIILIVHSSSFFTIWPIKWLKIPELLYAAAHLIIAWDGKNSIWYLPCYQCFLFSFGLIQRPQKKRKRKRGRRNVPQNKILCLLTVKKIGVLWVIIPSFMPWLVTKSLLQRNHVLLMSKYFDSNKERFHWNGINSQVEIVCNRARMTAFITCEILLSQLSCTLFSVFSEYIWQP